ncbi:MAG: hypothetical protein ABL986_14095 [Vicinamibacterales bacterium]
MRRRGILGAVALVLALASQASAQESQFAADLRREKERLAAACSSFSVGALGSCVYTLVTDSPFKLSLGSLAPGNGFAFGLAFSERYTPNESWRLTWNGDMVGTASGSWRGGGSMKMVHTPATSGVIVAQPGTAPARIRPREFTVIDVFAQKISLETIDFYGTGASSREADRAIYGEGQTTVGGMVTYPLGRFSVLEPLRPAVIGGITGRFVNVRPSASADAPSIEALYTDATAPGLAQQKPFIQFTEALRLAPSLANGWLQLNYTLAAHQFRSDEETRSSFNRWTIDLRHEIPLYRGVTSTGPRDFNGPNDCAQALGSTACPPVQRSRNRGGSVSVRLLVSSSSASDGHRVPFYLQPTLGGSDLNGERLLASFADYRFRAPHVIALQETLEHSIWGPIGAFVQAEHGKAVDARSDLDFGKLVSNASVGVTVRAGGFPMLTLSFSWGREGHHIIGSMNNSLLGGSSRPPLF